MMAHILFLFHPEKNMDVRQGQLTDSVIAGFASIAKKFWWPRKVFFIKLLQP